MRRAGSIALDGRWPGGRLGQGVERRLIQGDQGILLIPLNEPVQPSFPHHLAQDGL